MPQEMLFLAILAIFCIGLFVFGLWIKTILKEKTYELIDLRAKNEQLSSENLALNMQSAKLQAELNAKKRAIKSSNLILKNKVKNLN